MKDLLKSRHPRRRLKSFKYAFEGIFHTLVNEPNFRIQLCIALITLFLGLYYKITTTEWGLIILSLGALLSAEMVNTLVEEVIDHFFKEERQEVKIIKDVAAGFVLVTAVTAAIIIALIFGQRIL